MFDEIGERAMGRAGRLLVYGSIYLTILAEPIILQLTCVESLMQMLYTSGITRLQANVAVAVMVMPMAQVSVGAAGGQGPWGRI